MRHDTPTGHAHNCDWHCDQYEPDCTCGASAKPARLPTDGATGESFCPRCGEPDPEVSVEAFEVYGDVMCVECADAEFEAEGRK